MYKHQFHSHHVLFLFFVVQDRNQGLTLYCHSYCCYNWFKIQVDSFTVLQHLYSYYSIFTVVPKSVWLHLILQSTLSNTQGSLYSSLHISSKSWEHKPDHYTYSVCCDCWGKWTGNRCHQNNSGKGQSNQGNEISHLEERQRACSRCGG